VAQQESNPPKVIAVTREWTKPGRNGGPHEKTESAFVQAFTKAKWPTHYLAVDSLSGKPRSLFLAPYDSLEAWEKDVAAEQKNDALSAALDRANTADGENLSGVDQGVLMYREDLSLRGKQDIAQMRYFEIARMHMKPGHDKEFEELAKLYQRGFEKNNEVHWAMYQAMYGQEDGTYVLFNPMKSLAEVDRGIAAMAGFTAALGEDGMKRLAELTAAAIDNSETHIFAFNPRMSYPFNEWVKADPGFWRPKPAAAPKAAAKPAEKPAQ
jgi:hypothetical protein